MMAKRTVRLGTTVNGEAFELPGDVLTLTTAILAKKGAGKSYTAGVMEEEFIHAGLPFVVLDPVGVHWGIRSSKDGKGEGLPVVVFGGEEADVPITRAMGPAVAMAIMEENISGIVDLTELSKTAWREFVRDFCRTLYEKNRRYGPRHVFIEEATEFVPQTRRPEMQETYEAVERMVRLGRNRGLGVTIITQRAAQVAKDVLYALDILIALRTVGTLDRKAMIDMFADVLEDDDLPRLEEFKQTIARLDDGEAFVWSPATLKCFERIRVRERETFHAGATPTMGAVKVVQARPDVAALRARLAPAEPETEGQESAPGAKRPRKAAANDTNGRVEQITQLREKLKVELDRHEELRTKLARLQEAQAVTLEELERQTAANEAATTLQRALVGFIGVTPGNGVPVADTATIVREVMARLPANGASPPIAAPEALRKKYLQATADRLVERARGVSENGRTALEFLLGQDKFFTLNAVAMALGGSDSGGARDRWGKALNELKALDLTAKGGTGRSSWRENVGPAIAAALAQHGAKPDEVERVKAVVLHELVTS